jgi:hypothetical protein
MTAWTSNATFEGDPQQLLDALTEIEAIERWSPVPFRVEDEIASLRGGESIGVEGVLLGRGVHFQIDVAHADDTGISLRARGPFEIDVDYTIRPDSTKVEARVETRGRGAVGRLLASAANALLSAGVLDHTLRSVMTQAAARPAPIAP